MKAILFQMPIMPIMTFAPSYWCIRSANPFGRQKCPGSQLLHLEALGQEIGSQSLKDLRIYENQRWFKKNSKNSKDLHRDVRAALPGSSAVGGRPITAARRGGNGWRQHQWHQCRLQRDQRIYGFPRHPARHVATACHGTSSTFFTESIYTVAPLPCRNRAVPCGTFIPCVVASFFSQDHIIFTYIHIWSHTITWTRNDLDPGHLSSTYQHHILKRPIHPYTSYTNTVHTLPELQNRVPAMMVFLKAKCNFTVSSKLVAGCCKGWNLHGRLQGVVQLIEDAHLQSSGRKYVKCIKNKNQKSRVFRTLSA